MAPRTPKDTEKKAAKPAKTAQSAAKTKASPVVAKPELKVVATPAASEAAAGGLKLRDLIDSVATATGGKKPDVKKTVEATLAALAEALANGKALTIPPLGKLRVVKTKGPVLTLKLRRAEGAKAAGLALADDGEDG
jgi:hypothetical protein